MNEQKIFKDFKSLYNYLRSVNPNGLSREGSISRENKLDTSRTDTPDFVVRRDQSGVTEAG